jgi:hypothetical protein
MPSKKSRAKEEEEEDALRDREDATMLTTRSAIPTRLYSVTNRPLALAPHTQALRKRAERDTADAPCRGRRHYPPMEQRAGTPSRGGAILGSVCATGAQNACLSSNIQQNTQKFVYFLRRVSFIRFLLTFFCLFFFFLSQISSIVG